MNNKNWYDEVKENSIKNINDSYTLNLAVSVLEDRKELLNENLKLQQELQQKEDIINKAKEFIKKHNEKAGKLYYKYNNKYLLSEIKEDLLEILNIDKGE